MNLLFWNLAHHDNTELAIRAIKEKDTDIAILAEHSGIDAKAIVDTLGPEYREGPSQAGCDKIKSVMKSGLRIHTASATIGESKLRRGTSRPGACEVCG